MRTATATVVDDALAEADEDSGADLDRRIPDGGGASETADQLAPPADATAPADDLPADAATGLPDDAEPDGLAEDAASTGDSVLDSATDGAIGGVQATGPADATLPEPCTLSTTVYQGPPDTAMLPGE